MKLSTLEQEVINVALLVKNVAAALVSANNTQYDGIVSAASTFSDTAASALAPGSAAPASTLPADIVAGVIPVTTAIETVSSKTATASQKAAALTTLIGEAETIGEDVWNAIATIFTKKAAVPAA